MNATCPITRQPLPPGMFVHRDAIAHYRGYLRVLPDLFTDLAIQHHRQSRLTPTSTVTAHTNLAPIPFDDRTTQPTYIAKATLLAWLDHLWVKAEHGDPQHAGLPPDTWAGVAWWLWHTAPWLATQPDAPTAIDEISRVIDLATRVIDNPSTHHVDIPGAGCPHVDDQTGTYCDGHLYAIVRDPDNPKPTTIYCERDDDHQYPMREWFWLGANLTRRGTAA